MISATSLDNYFVENIGLRRAVRGDKIRRSRILFEYMPMALLF